MRVRAFFISLAIVFLLFLNTCRAEAKSGQTANNVRQTVSGTANDALNRPLAGVELILQTQDGKIVSRAHSDKAGHFEFGTVTVGSYMVVANKAGFQTAVATVAVTQGGATAVEVILEAETALNLEVTAKRLEAARNGLSPETGSSVYRFSQQAIQQLPQGTNTQMTGVLLQAPSVAQDSFGQLHIRGEHGEIQYRVNGIELPEGIAAGFSQTFSPRLARSISLLEGALPAQYGYHTAGVVAPTSFVAVACASRVGARRIRRSLPSHRSSVLNQIRER
jgi:hypothetical protein